MHVDPEALRETIDALAKFELGEHDLAKMLGHAVVATAELVGVPGCGVMLTDEDGVLRYVAASDEAGRRLEEVQEREGIGPCIDCVVENRVIVSNDFDDSPAGRSSPPRSPITASPASSACRCPWAALPSDP